MNDDAHKWYTSAVEFELNKQLDKFIDKFGDTEGRLSLPDQERFVRQFIKSIKPGGCGQDYIRGFNAVVGAGPVAVADFLDNFDGKINVAHGGTKWIRIRGIARIASKLPVVKVLTIATAWRYYNDLRADGYPAKEALALTGLDVVIPVPGVGMSNVTDAIKKYREVNAQTSIIALGMGFESDASNSHILRNPAVRKGQAVRGELDKLGIDSTKNRFS